MSKVRSQDSKIEMAIRKELWKRGFRYRKADNKYFGKPDIILPKYKTVLFIDSCFWHGCENHYRMPKSNTDYWQNKINNNKKRDNVVDKHYQKIDWQVIRIWEHEIKDLDFRELCNKITAQPLKE